MQKERRGVFSIQYLRGIAAVGVVVFHIGEIFNLQLKFGGAGVDLFFVISGFIMWMVTRQRETNCINFIKKRLLRIVPLYWMVSVFVAICALLRPNLFPVDHPDFQHVILSLLFIPHIAPDGKLLPLIGQGWTLNYEVFFYFLFALTLAVSKKSQFYLLNGLLLSCVGTGFLLSPASPAGEVYTSPLLFEFLLGIYICRAWQDKMLLNKFMAWISILVGITLIAIGYVSESHLSRIILNGAPAAFIIFGAISLEVDNALPKIKALKILGDASYSIYLTHYLTWLCVSIIITKIGGYLNMITYAVTVLTAIIGGIIVYYCLERPLHNLLLSIFIKAREPNEVT